MKTYIKALFVLLFAGTTIVQAQQCETAKRQYNQHLERLKKEGKADTRAKKRMNARETMEASEKVLIECFNDSDKEYWVDILGGYILSIMTFYD